MIDKGRVAEERQISDTVRKQHVDVKENYREARAGGIVAEEARTAADLPGASRGGGQTNATGGESWEELREEVREGGKRTQR